MRSIIKEGHPLRELFKTAIEKGSMYISDINPEARNYLEQEILCEFLHIDNLYKIKDAQGRRLEDIADMLSEGDIRMNAPNFEREFLVHKHIGDYTLFMLGFFPSYLNKKKGKEFIMGGLVIPCGDLSELYELQGKHSYHIASTFFKEHNIFETLSRDFLVFRNILEFVRIYLEALKEENYLRVKRLISE